MRVRAATLLAFAGLLAALFAWSHGHWPDMQVDFGRELYVPWRIVEGERLYTDLSYFNGPLSPYWNAAWFEVLGVSLRSLAWVNLGLTAVSALLIHHLARRATGRAGAAAATLAFLGVFGFGQYAAIANYNFICPYSHELTHGFLLSLAALACIDRVGRRSAWALAGGLALGLCFLTKAEVFVAGAASVGTLLAVRLAAPSSGGRRGRLILAFAIGCALPPAASGLALAGWMTPSEAALATLGSWRHVFSAEVRELPFYRAMLGVDEPWKNVGKALAWAGGYLAWFGALTAVAARLDADRARGAGARAAGFGLGIGSAGLLLGITHWNSVGRPYPLFITLFGLAALVHAVRARHDEEELGRAGVRLASIVLAALFAAKMVLYLRLKHYGFVLALPATLVVIGFAVHVVPSWLTRRGRGGAFLAAAALGAVVALALVHVYSANKWYAEKGRTLGWGADRFHASSSWRGPEFEMALADLRERVQPGETMIVLPEGVMLNYLLRRRNPTPYYNFMPPEMIFFGEARMLAAFEASPPDYVVVAHKDTAEYGFPFFGRDYGVEIMRWVRRNYRESAVYGLTPLVGTNQIGVSILEPRER